MSYVKFHILEAASRSTIHGLPHSANLHSPFALRFFWIICLLVSSGFCAYTMFMSISKYMEYGVITTVQKIGESPAPFPKVTICNSNYVSNQASVNFASRVYEENSELKDDIIDQYEALERYVALEATNANISSKEKDSFGSDLREMVISCEFGSIKCDLDQVFWYNYDSIVGRCYNFNTGLNMNSTPTPILYSSLVGKKYGLRLKLYVPHVSRFETFSSIYGVKVAVHNQSFVVSAAKFDTFDVAVDTEANVRVSRDFTTKLPSPYNDCVQDLDTYDSIFVKMFKDVGTYYIRQFCYRLCLKLVEKCDCHDPAFTLFGRYTLGRRPCQTYQDYKCLNTNFEYFFHYEMNQNCSRECPLECVTYDYSISATAASFPKDNYYYVMLSQSEYLARTVLNMSNLEVANLTKSRQFDKLPSLDEISSSLKGKTVSLNVYYDDLGYTLVQESPEIYLIDLIANLGGLLGLWVGASFMSFLEFFDLAVQLVLGFLKSEFREKNLISRPNPK